MIFDKSVRIERLQEAQPGTFSWNTAKRVWARAENPLSQYGLGAKTMRFTLPATGDITPHDFIVYHERFYWIDDINRDRPLLMVITAVDVCPVDCTALRTIETEGANKTAVFTTQSIYRFPGFFTGHTYGFEQREPMARTQTILRFVTPKVIALEPNDLVEIGGVRYAVHFCHTLEEYRNEYEIIREEDV